MSVAKDILLDDELDIQIENGDLVIDESDAQHIELLFALDLGELKESPLVGIGIARSINGSIDGSVRKRAKLQLEADGYTVAPLDNLENGIIDAYRKE